MIWAMWCIQRSMTRMAGCSRPGKTASHRCGNFPAKSRILNPAFITSGPATTTPPSIASSAIPTDRAIYNPQRWNLYGYCLGNPINFVDPFGDITIRIWRTLYNNYATYGVYEIELGETRIWGFTMEPALGKGKGPIPAGVYDAEWFYSTEKGELRIKIDDVPSFEYIRIHKGNKPRDTTGCILVGKGVNTGGNLLDSGRAMAEIIGGIMDYQLGALKEHINEGDFDLELLHWLFDMQVIIYKIPKGTVTVEVTSARYLIY